MNKTKKHNKPYKVVYTLYNKSCDKSVFFDTLSDLQKYVETFTNGLQEGVNPDNIALFKMIVYSLPQNLITNG